MKQNAGFTLIELLVTLVIIGILAAAVFPLSETSVRRAQEKELRQALWEIRGALDAYKRAVDEGRILRSADQSGYPPSLGVLVEGVTDAKDPKGRKIYFLRRVPRDPMADDPAAAPEQTWGKRSYDSPPESPRAGRDIFDVYSLSRRTGLNGIPYREW
ncbi:MAG: type II secretion system protein [Rhodocyclales bacterium]|nr:type II secretion system protein [Rhodocyclales bacterium]